MRLTVDVVAVAMVVAGIAAACGDNLAGTGGAGGRFQCLPYHTYCINSSQCCSGICAGVCDTYDGVTKSANIGSTTVEAVASTTGVTSGSTDVSASASTSVSTAASTSVSGSTSQSSSATGS